MEGGRRFEAARVVLRLGSGVERIRVVMAAAPAVVVVVAVAVVVVEVAVVVVEVAAAVVKKKC